MYHMQFAKLISYLEWYEDRSRSWTLNWWSSCFTTMVKPHLERGNVIWHQYLKQDIALLEEVQHRATEMVPGLAMLSYEERLRKMNLPSLVYRRTRSDAIEVYKYLQWIYKVDCSELLPLHEPGNINTRCHSLKLKKRSCKLQQRQNFLEFELWTYGTAPSVNCFKGRFDRHCRRNMFVTEWADYNVLDWRSVHWQPAYSTMMNN